MKEKVVFQSIDQYHSTLPLEIQSKVQELRMAIRQAAPKSTEVISYNMPAFKMNKVLVYYAAAKAHIGFYPTPGPIIAFEKELSNYVTSKGAIQFPINEKLPITLIKKIVKFRVLQDQDLKQKKK
ncbi:MAG: DUF1801 domain-containing protein [Saprospiraceae bacterium]|nr:DUF1801 domain-containing protein [Saprospiraceae bacterium]